MEYYNYIVWYGIGHTPFIPFRNVGMAGWMYWLTKHTNKKRHSSIKKLSRQNISRKQTVLYSRNGSGEKKSETRLFQSTKHTSHIPAYKCYWLQRTYVTHTLVHTKHRRILNYLQLLTHHACSSNLSICQNVWYERSQWYNVHAHKGTYLK